MKARDWLVARGLAKPGRGKFSGEAHKALAKAVSEGERFSDYPKDSATKIPAGSSTAKNPAKNSATKNPTKNLGMPDILLPQDFRYPEKGWVARGADGKVYTVRECCNTCRVSLTNHGCDNPTIHDSLSVTMERR